MSLVRVVRCVVLSTLAAALVAGCNCGGSPSEDAGEPPDDAGLPDAAVDDAGTLPPDAGPDAGADAGDPLDAGTSDAGTTDAGRPDAGSVTCHACHGSALNAAPPVDTDGGVSTSLTTVGAHQSHLQLASAWHRDGQCEDCHVVPTTVDAPGHLGPAPAELTFGPVATSNGVAAAFDGARCATWCHGVALDGGLNPQPQWTRVDGTESYCGSCHGVPPPPPHPAITNFACGGCHPNASSGGAFVDPQRHIDGHLDVVSAVTCTTCHGSTNPAPPKDLAGRTATTERGVGAHQSHLRTAGWHREVQCADCHVVPAQPDAPGHLGPLPAELTWSQLPRTSGAVPSWDGGTCTNYCHGATLGGALTTPTWTRVDGTQAACGTCHGLPPPAPHPQQTDCGRCHPTADGGSGFSAPERHVDGVVDVNSACDSCHGSNGNPAPPRDLAGNVSTSVRGVGAHRSHLGPSGWHAEVTCDDCHVVPVTVGEPGHLDVAPAEVTFGALAQARGASPSWNGLTCSGAYCHGGSFDAGQGGSNVTPQWTQVNGTQAACGTCHGLPPGGPHPNNPQCSFCHGAVLRPDGGFVDPNLHINGLVEASTTCGSCHALPPQTGAHVKHAALAAPVYGGLGTAAGVPGATAYAFGCGLCHPMDPSLHGNGGRAEVELANPLAPAGSLKALSPTAQYTPGGATYQDATGLPYSLGTCSNVYCHSATTWTTPNGVPSPGVDFPFTGYPITYPAYPLVTGRAFVSIGWGGANPGCGGCHGLPPRTSMPQVTAMAGQSHSYIDAQGYEYGHAWNHGFAPLSCRTCHAQTVTAANTTTRDPMDVATYGPVPIVGFGLHVNGRPDVVFDTVNPLPYTRPVLSLSTASYSQATHTCSNVACHFQQTAVRSGTPYREQNQYECNTCHQY